MSTLFGRKWQVVVGITETLGLDVSNLDIEFKVLRTLRAPPNRCVLNIWNLNKDHRSQLLKRNRPNPSSGKTVGVPVEIRAGYTNNTSTIFLGDLREVSSVRDRTDWKTTLSGDDGGRAYRESRISKTFTKGTPISTVLQQCVEALNIGTGNVASFLADAAIAGIGGTLPHTMTLAGNAAQQLSRLLNSMGLTWSIQNGVVAISKKGEPINLEAVLITPSTGLIGSPEAGVDASVSLGNPQQFANVDTSSLTSTALGVIQLAKGTKATKQPKPRDVRIVKLKTMLIPGLFPGRKIVLQSDAFDGGFVLTECEYVGQSWGNDWHINAVARQYT